MNNFIISLKDNNEDRRTHISNQFNSKNIPFLFFDAINKSNLDISEHLNIRFNNPNLTAGEKGCFLSHIFLWKKIIDENIDVAGIFEDDIYLGKNSEELLRNYSWVNKNIDIIKIEKSNDKIKTSIRPIKKVNDIQIVRLKSRHLGTAGYIITNKGAHFLFDKISQKPINNPIDHEIFNDLLINNKYIVGQTMPCLCIQDFVLNKNDNNFPSILEDNRIHRVIHNKTGSNNKIIRELSRLKQQILDFTLKNTIERKVYFYLK
ncbi:glycosyltransferase family 25 protein [Proteus cibarius]|nr:MULTISPECIES: glycosyltransferase family 25 protein [Proteus]MBG3012017.1 glycosyltransferase family 25 protein [Proteus mirabilis]MBG6039387.1 glycosyltransferase family 25 protein [Proteus terrae subsp. cibarius]MCT8249422.1 glycosyltransferase family 25 protein [Proteus faecis]